MDSEIIFNLVSRILINLFDTYIMYRLMSIFFDSYKNRRLTIVAYGVHYILPTLFNTFASYMFLNMITIFLTMAFIVFTYNATFSKKIMISLTMFILCALPEFILSLIVGLSGLSYFQPTRYDTVFFEIILEALIWMESIVLRHFKNIRQNIPIPRTLLVVISIVPIISLALELLFLNHPKVEQSIYILTLLCFFGSLFTMMYLYDFLSIIFRERTRVELIKKEKTYYHNQSELLQQNHEELRQFRHDIKNRLIVIQQLLDANEPEHASAYMNTITNRLDETSHYSSTGNTAIDSILNYKLAQAARNNTDIICNIAIPENILIEDDDIVIILGNLIDNAAEATMHLTQNRFIHVNIEYDLGSLFIRIRNSYNSVLKVVNGKLRTIKNDDTMHGIGLRSVENITEKYNGMLDLDYDKHVFEANVLLYIPSSNDALPHNNVL